MMANLKLAALGQMSSPPAGMAATTLAKMRMDMPVADAPLGDELAQPHDEGGAGGEGQDDEAGRATG